MSSVSSVSSISSVDLSISSNSSSDSDDYERPRRREPRLFHVRRHPFDYYDDEEFKNRFRLSKETVTHILELIENQIKPSTYRNQSISALNQLLIALKFYASGSFQINIGDHFHVTKATVGRIILKVSIALASLREEFITMPNTQEKLNHVCTEFYQISGFPNVCGAIDGSHIRIQSPGGDNAEVFRNRKGWFSINIQIICDANLKIMDVVARWPGSAHDSQIFDNSFVRARFENQEFGNTYLLGDSGYACRSYLLTPLLNPRTAGEQRYNRAHITTRNTVERTFGVLKRRFPCLSLGLRLSLNRLPPVIVATCVLHNIARNLNDLKEQPNEEHQDDQPEINVGQGVNNTGVRNAVINTVFS